MNHLVALLAVIIVLTFAIGGCGDRDNESNASEHSSSGTNEHSRESESGERDGGSGESNEEGEESGTQYALSDTYDEVRAGARLILLYDAGSNAFTGTVENTTKSKLSRVRVEVHLSNGIELGPTTPVDLAAGESTEVMLVASSEPFSAWEAHPEVGGGENTESGGEHGGSERLGEHGGESESGGEHQ